jgi:hypothetical protein
MDKEQDEADEFAKNESDEEEEVVAFDFFSSCCWTGTGKEGERRGGRELLLDFVMKDLTSFIGLSTNEEEEVCCLLKEE